MIVQFLCLVFVETSLKKKSCPESATVLSVNVVQIKFWKKDKKNGIEDSGDSGS